MTVYNKSVDFAIKDSLVSGDPNKIVRGTEIDTEFTNIEAALDSVQVVIITPLDFGAVGDGVTDDTSELQAAATAQNGKTLVFPPGTYKVSGNINFVCDCEFQRGAVVYATNNSVVTFSRGINAPKESKIFQWDAGSSFSITGFKYVSVDWFGVTKVLGTDDSPAVQMAIDSLSFGTVEFQTGTYNLYTKITSNSGQKRICGQSMRDTFLRKKILDDDMFHFTPVDVTGTAITDLTFNDFRCTTDFLTEVHTAGAFIRVDIAQRVTFEHLLLVQPYIGLKLTSITNSTLYDVTSTTTSSAALFTGFAHIWMAEEPTAVKREHANVFFDAVRGTSFSIYQLDPDGLSYKIEHGLIIEASDGIYIENSYFGNTGFSDVLLKPPFADSRLGGLRFTNCWFDPVAKQTGSANFVIDASNLVGTTGYLAMVECSNTQFNNGVNNILIKTKAGTRMYDIHFDTNQIQRAYESCVKVVPTADNTLGFTGFTFNNNIVRSSSEDGAFPVIDMNCSKDFNISGNILGYQIVSESFSDASVGISIAATCSGYTIVGNNLTGLVADIIDNGVGPKRIEGNLLLSHEASSDTALIDYGGIGLTATDWLDNNPLTGIVDSKVGSFVAKMKFDNAGGAGEYLLHSTGTRFGIQRSVNNFLTIQASNETPTIILSATLTAVDMTDPGVYTLFGSWDMTDSTKTKMYVNDTTGSMSQAIFTNDTIDYTAAEYAMGATSAGTFPVDGDIVMIWFAPGQYVDWSIEANRRKFFDLEGNVEFLGLSGEVPTGVAPILFHCYDFNTEWYVNRGTSASTWTVNGTINAPSQTYQGYDHPRLKYLSYTVTATPHTVGSQIADLVINVAGTTTLTLPNPLTYDEDSLRIRTLQNQAVISASSNVIPITGGAAGTSILPATAGKWVEMIPSGSNWQVVAGN